MGQGSPPRDVHAVRRALRLLDVFTEAEVALRVTDLSQRTGMAKSTVHQLLATLVRLGYAEQDPATRLYHLGTQAMLLGAAAQRMVGLGSETLALMERLSRATNETVSLAVRQGDTVVIVQRVETTEVLRVDIQVGTRLPLYASAAGLAIVAAHFDLLNALGDPPDPHSTHLRAKVTEVADQGYAITHDQPYPGVSALATAVHLRSWARSEPLALVIAGPTSRFDARQHVSALLAAARQIER